MMMEENNITTPLIDDVETPAAAAEGGNNGLTTPHNASQHPDRQLSIYPPRPRKDRIALFEPPRQRQRWGEKQVLPHINWGDLYFDLFYVSAAYNLSKILMYTPSAEGFLYLLGLMGPILVEWFSRTYFDARFAWGTDPFHFCIELLRLCFLATAVVHIRPVNVMSQPCVYPDMFGFSLGALCLSICNIYVSLEVKFKVVGEDAAKYAERENIINFCVQSVFYLLATVVAGLAYYKNDGQYHEDKEEGYHPPKLDSLLNACSLMLTGGSTDNYLEASQSEGPSPTNLPIALCVAGWVFGVVFWPLKWVFIPYAEQYGVGYSVPLNVEFCIHRFGELVMLLLGESVLSLLIVETSTTDEYYITLYAGIISVTLLQYIFFKYQPHSAEEHALRRSWKAGALFHLCMFIYCFSLVTLGTAYKMFLTEHKYKAMVKPNNLSDDGGLRQQLMTLIVNLGGDDDSSTGKSELSMEERKKCTALIYCLSMAVASACLDIMAYCHKGVKVHLSFMKSKAGAIISIFRFGTTSFLATLCVWVHESEVLVLVGMFTLMVDIFVCLVSDYYFSLENKEEFDLGHWHKNLCVREEPVVSAETVVGGESDRKDEDLE